jgi:hypothetical protein
MSSATRASCTQAIRQMISRTAWEWHKLKLYGSGDFTVHLRGGITQRPAPSPTAAAGTSDADEQRRRCPHARLQW